MNKLPHKLFCNLINFNPVKYKPFNSAIPKEFFNQIYLIYLVKQEEGTYDFDFITTNKIVDETSYIYGFKKSDILTFFDYIFEDEALLFDLSMSNKMVYKPVYTRYYWLMKIENLKVSVVEPKRIYGEWENNPIIYKKNTSICKFRFEIKENTIITRNPSSFELDIKGFFISQKSRKYVLE